MCCQQQSEKPQMQDFYSFYTKKMGKLSATGFTLFWNSRNEDACQFYERLIESMGAISELGMTDALIYMHCKLANGSKTDVKGLIPPPLDREELQAIHSYEQSREQIAAQYRNDQEAVLQQPIIMSKAIIAAMTGIKHNCIDAIETGTYLGETAYIFSGIFNQVETIEADMLLHQSSTRWLTKTRNNITTHQGNSPEILRSILTDKKNRCLLFLDAHWSTGITSREHGVCPLREELSIIFGLSHDHVIVIDDMRCMGSPGFPSITEIINLIPAGKKISIEADQMIIS